MSRSWEPRRWLPLPGHSNAVAGLEPITLRKEHGVDDPKRTIIANGRVLTPSRVIEHGAVVLEGNTIAGIEVGQIGTEGADVVDASGLTVLPGFVDIHVHGAMDREVMDATPEAIAEMACFYAGHGVTGFLPSTLTATPEETQRAVDNITRCQGMQLDGARILGIHLEGPYLSPKFPGAQRVEDIRRADPAEYERLFAAGNVRLITLAPEIGPANQELIGYAVAHGAAVAIGHSSAGYDDVVAAIERGASQATHTFNGMRGLHHRDPGTAGAVLARDELFAQIIVDFVHLHPAIVKVVVRAKGIDRTVLISDAMRAAGAPEGDYDLGGYPVTVRDGVATLKGTNTLAGSTLTMDRALRNVMQATGLSLFEAYPMATSVPAKSIGLQHEVGSIQPGYAADIILVDDDLNVHLTIVQVKVVYRR